MENLLEFEIVALLRDPSREEETQRYLELGIEPPKSPVEEKIVKYAFDCSCPIAEVRETFVTYRGETLPAVVVTFTEDYMYTPPLLTTIEELKSRIYEHFEKSNKTE